MSRRVASVVRRGNRFCFRMALPKKAAKLLGAHELKLALGTEMASVAKRRGRVLRNAAEVILEGVTLMHEPKFEALNQHIRSYFQRLINGSLETSYFVPSIPDYDAEAEVGAIDDRVSRLRTEAALQSFEKPQRQEARRIVREAGVREADWDAVQYACNGVLRAEIEDARILAARLAGKYEHTAPRDPLFAGLSAVLPPVASQRGTQETQTGLTFGTATERFLELKTPTWAPKTAADERRVMALAKEIVGENLPVHMLCADHIRNVRDAITNIPPNYMKAAGNKLLTAKEAAEQNCSGRRLSPKTQDKYFTMFRQLLLWMESEAYVEKVPGAKIKLPAGPKGGRAKKRYPYSIEQLGALLASPLFRGCKSDRKRHVPGHQIFRDGKYWVPLICIMSGMRMGEAAQLTASDIKQENEIWYFDVNKRDDLKRTKTESSVRRVPIHSALLKAGVLKLCAGKKSSERLFPEIQRAPDGTYSHNLSKWYGRYSRKIGVFVQKTAFHSFRHNFTDALAAAAVPDYISKELVGHLEQSVHAMYRSQLTLSNLKREIEKVEYPIDLPVTD